jgi:DNA-binding transcriptional MerR regulator
MGSRVTIGDFARASHLSVKTLRHYHDVGLLEPSEVDPDNGYRYYSEKQIQAAQVIRRLRGLQMPVPDVKAVLTATDSEVRNGLIVEHLNRLEDDLAQTTAAVSQLRDLLERPDAPRAIEHRTVAPTPAAGIQATIDREDALDWWRGALGELQATVGAQALNTTGPSGGLYASEIFQHGRGQATVFIPTEEQVKPIGRVVQLLIPEAELAIACHDGSLVDIDLTYGELGAYAMKHEISLEGPLRENYLRGFLDTPDTEEWQTEIGWPIFRADRSTE